MGTGKKLATLIGMSIVFGVEIVWLVIGVLIRSIWRCAISSGAIALTIYYFYVRLYLKKKARYPIVPPEGKTDIYFPRTDIPRPVYADFRRMKEKKQRFAKLRKRISRKKK